ncbi:NUDIX domain-containing protein [Candidatus Methylospira mobilis]|uniref:NUDIX domain-containing protein n=1 Tax=Candidatus Methylospira mobilis TaxID=1808979 RepID=A0A5Q0BHG0_9GAMM|nr:NUDIX domain-containing protein [Candidatus Methylospira mobilis]QFY43263.1 NUDIX domain-containing protein [Candidatus Methylospira mobilis]WNV03536.1 NUDIX domain-containing protein [Candidatus Methylospira mobilis]
MNAESYLMGVRRKFGQGLLLNPSVAAVVLDESKRLLLQEKFNEAWSLPAGAIESGESPREAVIREVWEDTGYNVTVKSIIDVFGGREFRYTYPNGDRIEYAVTLFHCEITSGDSPFIDTETKSIRYFSENEMPALALPYPIAALFLKDSYSTPP